MDVYSPSHPTDQDADGGVCSDLYEHVEKKPETEVKYSQHCDRFSPDTECTPITKESHLPKSPDLSPNLSNSPNIPSEVVLAAKDSSATVSSGPTKKTSKQDDMIDETHVPGVIHESTLTMTSNRPHEADLSTRDSAAGYSGRKDKKSERVNLHSDMSPVPTKDSSRHSASRLLRHRSRSLKRKRSSRSPDRLIRKRSSSHSRYRSSHGRRRSRSRDRRRRRSRSTSRGRRDRHRRSSHKEYKTFSRSRSRQENVCEIQPHGLRKGQSTHILAPGSFSLPSPTVLPAPSPPENPKGNESADVQYDMDETSTPDISEDNQPPVKRLNEKVPFVFRNHPLTSAPNFMNWHQSQSRSNFCQANHPANLQQLPSSLIQGPLQHHSRPSGYSNYQSRRVNSSTIREMPPHLIPQRPTFNATHGSRFPGTPSHFVAINGMLNPLLPFGGLLGQPPPPPPPSAMSANLPYTAPPPPFIQQINTTSSLSFQQHPRAEIQPASTLTSPPPPPPPPPSQSNLLETLMSKVGLPTNGITALSSVPSSGGGAAASTTAIPLPDPVEDKSPMKKINKLLNTAANTLLNQLNVPEDINNTPPPPPPPLPAPCRGMGKSDPSFSSNKLPIPPLPAIHGVVGVSGFSNGNGSNLANEKPKSCHTYNIQEMLARRRRSEFSNTREWQERIALEVKSFIKPFYAAGKVSKEDCRTVLKKSVNKISRSRCTSINTKKIGEFVKLYLKRYYKYRKWQARQQQLQSESVAKEPSVQ